jgi:hypothetical protein
MNKNYIFLIGEWFKKEVVCWNDIINKWIVCYRYGYVIQSLEPKEGIPRLYIIRYQDSEKNHILSEYEMNTLQ